VIIKLAEGLGKIVADWSEYDRAEFILRFVQQNVTYITDEKRFGQWHKEKWVFPVDTLKARLGDCEDKSFLCDALMRLNGLDAVLISVPGHICVGVNLNNVLGGRKYTYDGKLYYHAETIENIPIGSFTRDLGEPDCIMPAKLPDKDFLERLRDDY